MNRRVFLGALAATAAGLVLGHKPKPRDIVMVHGPWFSVPALSTNTIVTPEWLTAELMTQGNQNLFAYRWPISYNDASIGDRA